ncbi:prepilin-type cleavage/methylation domain-containing protein [Thermus sp.]|uniref:prepilin-type cleavage/methylation domain-containing protein n=1 Tax=Thermus sp. TaxID=275 RepID=UPI00307E7F5A
MRKGLTLLEIAFALLALSVLALFVLEPFTRVLLASQETTPLEKAVNRAQEVLEGYRVSPPAPLEGCGAPVALEGGLSYQVCSFSEGILARYEVRILEGGELLTALVTHQRYGP